MELLKVPMCRSEFLNLNSMRDWLTVRAVIDRDRGWGRKRFFL